MRDFKKVIEEYYQVTEGTKRGKICLSEIKRIAELSECEADAIWKAYMIGWTLGRRSEKREMAQKRKVVKI